MPEPTSIVAFITAQFDREYRDAQLISNGGYRPQRWEVAARGGEWPFATCMSEIIAHDQINTETWDQPHEQNRMALVDDGRNQDEHIARYDPQRICLEIEAKRRDGRGGHIPAIERQCAKGNRIALSPRPFTAI